MAETMRTWQYAVVTGKLEDSIAITQVAKPSASSLAKGQILVEIINASLNPVDYKIPESGFIGRMMITRPATPGLDFCGRVIARHSSSKSFEEGQIVFGGFQSPSQLGTLGEYTVISQEQCTLLPDNVPPEQAAAVGTAATTAYQSLMPDSLKPGAKIFINGGSGGVGTWTIQFAKALGAEVTTSCSTKNVELCRQLGADEVLDYTKGDVLSQLKTREKYFDLVIDNVGKDDELYNSKGQLLNQDGTFVQVGMPDTLSFSSVGSTFKKQLCGVVGGQNYYFVNMKNSADIFRRIGVWMAEGKVHAVIDQVFEWEQTPKAFEKLRGGHVKGKVVICAAQG
ncbi:zinc-binding oxidoreductase [Thelonectria olida]|uniref:Zinc-binding oxidoreductase n=1 Tax=Thelonectria olida TaxID=1576542 RepID=A0A9P9ANE0_9HYPO|nr:zinc-binding oxidoreductase [Thelonectria olida]